MRLRGEAMQNTISARSTAMKALIVRDEHLDDIEHIMPRIQASLPSGEVAEIANINTKSQVSMH
jgi:[acyl-carrier-protein] S-malonyltransferase